MNPVFFPNASAFRKWLEKNHQNERELLVGFYKVKSGIPSMTWSESVDQALCFGWIDGLRKSLDDKRYTIRFTPRRENSIWSLVNIKKMKELEKNGLMQPAGRAIFGKLKPKKSGVYTHENPVMKLDKTFERKFKASGKAWDFFISQAPSYQKVATRWIMSAKQLSTQNTRLEKLIAASERGKKLQ